MTVTTTQIMTLTMTMTMTMTDRNDTDNDTNNYHITRPKPIRVRGSCPQRVAGGSQPTCRRVIGWRARSAKQIAGGLSANRAKRETNLRALWAARGPGNRRRVAETKTQKNIVCGKLLFK